jgi:drug/metabolite transporter (DMT)-like permease
MPLRSRRSPLARIYLLLLLATVFWGGTAVAGKMVIQGIPPITAGTLRYGCTALLLLIVYARRVPDLRRLRRRELTQVLALGALGTFVNHLLFFFGLVWAPAAHGALIPPTTSPIWLLLLTARIDGEPVTGRRVGGMVAGLIGVVLVIGPERLLNASPGVLLGDLLFLAGGLSWAVYSFLSRRAMEHMPIAGLLALSMSAGTLLLAPFALLERPWRVLPHAPAVSWLALAYLTVAATFLAFLWWNIGLRGIGPGRIAVFSHLTPVFGVLAAWLILGERLAPLQILGASLAVAGVVACQGLDVTAAAARGRALLRRRRAIPWLVTRARSGDEEG